MSDGEDTERTSDPTWSPSRYALAFDRFDHPSDSGRGVIVVSHPAAPFIATLDRNGVETEEALQRVAYTYLEELHACLMTFGHEYGLDLPAGWLEALDPDSAANGFFGWLPIRPSFPPPAASDESRLQLTSHRLQRRTQPPSDSKTDTTVVMVGAETIPSADGERPINSDFGLQVFIHFRDDPKADDARIAITSVTADLPYGRYTTFAKALSEPGSAALIMLQSSLTSMAAVRQAGSQKKKGYESGKDEPDEISIFDSFKNLAVASSPDIEALYQLEDPLSFDRLRLIRTETSNDGQPIFEFEVSGKGIGVTRRDTFMTPYRFAATIAISSSAEAPELVVKPVSKSVMVTDAAASAQARVFEQDPPSWRDLDNLHGPLERYDWSDRRPTRSETELDAFRRGVDINPLLEDPSGDPDFAVRNCPDFARADPNDRNTKVVQPEPGVWPPVRADDHAAISAYHNCRSVFEIMRGFGIDTTLYFRATERPFDVFYRSGVSPGPGKSGQTINARVSLKPNDDAENEPTFIEGALCPMQMHLALANFSHRARWIPNDQAPTWAEPLGMAASERWMWHEFGHVFIAGRFGELELPFAHSVGDALAAVAADPLSRLADPRGRVDTVTDPRDRFENFRGYTYPFVFLTRRHDRCVRSGWSWGGTFHRPVIDSPEIGRDQPKGYISEQILSSTLFRLYRTLGGDTEDVQVNAGDKVPGSDHATRLTASDVTLFLIIRGIETFGLQPARAEELENILMQADMSLTSPLLTHIQSDPPRTHAWTGGQAHKVVRWAFEAQGMHLPDPSHIRNAPGDPPTVDIYIPDGRPSEEQTEGGIVQHGPGGYVPVSLDWAGQPRWHADVLPDADFPVFVNNRGSEDATHVSARGWFGLIEGNSETRGWDRNATIDWSSPFDLTPVDQTIAPGNDGKFLASDARPQSPNATHLILLVEVTCPADRANSDPDAELPCAVAATGQPPAMPRQLTDLVANDNNLGLWMKRLIPVA